MRRLYAKLRGKRGACYKVITDPKELTLLDFYNVPNISNAVNLGSGRLTERDELYKVELSDDLTRDNMIGQYLEKIDSTSDHSVLKAKDYEAVEVLYLVNANEVFFTKITQGCMLKNKTFLSFGEHPELERKNAGIDIPKRIDAYYDGNSTLYFNDYSTVRSIFNGLEDFFHEATKEEQDKFLANDIFDVAFDVKLGVRPARKIGMLLNNPPFDLNDTDIQAKLFEYAEQYRDSGIKLENNKFKIESSADADLVINIIGERFYTSPITNEKRQAHEATKVQ